MDDSLSTTHACDAREAAGTLRERVLAEIRARPAATRPQRHRLLTLCGLACALVLAAAGSAGATATWHRQSPGLMAGLTAILVWVMLPLRRYLASPLGPKPGALALRNSRTPLLLGICILGADLGADPPGGFTYAMFSNSLRCCGGVAGAAAVLLAIAIFCARRTVLLAPLPFARYLGTLAGCAACWAVSCACQHTELAHRALGHVLPVLLIGGVSCLLAPPFLKLRFRPSTQQ